MQIVIDIPEARFKDVQRIASVQVDRRHFQTAEQIIANGVQLPKGHGRLGDLDALREEVSSWGMNDYEPLDFIDAIDWADTIIEADKGEADGK